jgi:hypothetical protein
MAGLPDNDKQLLTTRCPECSNIFTFNRLAPPAEDEQLPVKHSPAPATAPQFPQEPPAPEETQLPSAPPLPPPAPEPPAPDPTDDEDFAIPLALREKMERERLEAAQKEAAQTDTPPVTPDAPPPDQGADESWDTDDSAELAPAPGKKAKGKLLSVTCPKCDESFGTPAPKIKGKVICPICEWTFMINSHGELMAKKALGEVGGGLAKIVGVTAIRNYQETVRESIEGIDVLRNSDNLHHHMRSNSGKAGFILMVVAVLGILFAGSLLFSIPGSNEDDPSGSVVLSGDVMSGMEQVEGAEVTITDLGLSDITNSQGGFLISGVEPGDHTLEVTASGKGTLIVKFTVGSKDTSGGKLDLDGLMLPESGTAEEDRSEARVERAGLVLALQAAFIFVVSLLALMAGLLAIQGKRFHATLFLSAVSIVSIGFFIGMVLAIFSVFLVILGRKEFIS